MTVRTRFAPSPTGYLHIGGARTALFNYLFAKHYNGEFLLRIEDTDFSRSNEDAKQAILTSLKWLNLIHDKDVVYQSEKSSRHVQIAKELLARGKAYYCFTSQEEIADLRQKAKEDGKHFIFHSKWRDADPSTYPKDIKPVLRIKAPRTGVTIVNDLLQGKIEIQNSHLDDMVLLRSDGTPTYMLAVVVDDYDMGITHIIRGDDHLNNASRQQLIYQFLDWKIPEMIHIPLIHAQDGAKLSKRHGAIGVGSYKEMGYLPEAINNYLLRLGWSHGDDEIIDRSQAIKWFGIEGLGKSPARIDFNKMRNMNAFYLRKMDNDVLGNIIFDNPDFKELSDESRNCISKAIDLLKPRSELITDLYDLANIFIIDKSIDYNQEAKDIIKESDNNLLVQVISSLENLVDFNKENIQNTLKHVATTNNLKLGGLMKYIRAFITGRTASPSVFEIMEIIGKDHTIDRLKTVSVKIS